jgi:hypothetical protein
LRIGPVCAIGLPIDPCGLSGGADGSGLATMEWCDGL